MLEELKRSWQRQTAEENEIQRRIWDRAAKDYGELPIPSLEDDPFLREMGRALPLTSSLRTLDIGCGSGIYSMALAPKVQEAVGVDISPAMIQAAGYGIAMGNATPDVLAAARYVTDDNNHDGVAKAIETYVLKG